MGFAVAAIDGVEDRESCDRSVEEENDEEVEDEGGGWSGLEVGGENARKGRDLARGLNQGKGTRFGWRRQVRTWGRMGKGRREK